MSTLVSSPPIHRTFSNSSTPTSHSQSTYHRAQSPRSPAGKHHHHHHQQQQYRAGSSSQHAAGAVGPESRRRDRDRDSRSRSGSHSQSQSPLPRVMKQATPPPVPSPQKRAVSPKAGGGGRNGNVNGNDRVKSRDFGFMGAGIIAVQNDLDEMGIGRVEKGKFRDQSRGKEKEKSERGLDKHRSRRKSSAVNADLQLSGNGWGRKAPGVGQYSTEMGDSWEAEFVGGEFGRRAARKEPVDVKQVDNDDLQYPATRLDFPPTPTKQYGGRSSTSPAQASPGPRPPPPGFRAQDAMLHLKRSAEEMTRPSIQARQSERSGRASSWSPPAMATSTQEQRDRHRGSAYPRSSGYSPTTPAAVQVTFGGVQGWKPDEVRRVMSRSPDRMVVDEPDQLQNPAMESERLRGSPRAEKSRAETYPIYPDPAANKHAPIRPNTLPLPDSGSPSQMKPPVQYPSRVRMDAQMTVVGCGSQQQMIFAYGARSKEEEAKRAQLVAACEGLSSLCSQWHASEYNRLKWGNQGAPMQYCPLTIAAPEYVHAIMTAQAVYEKELYGSGDDGVSSQTSCDSPTSSFGTVRTDAGDETEESMILSMTSNSSTLVDSSTSSPRSSVAPSEFDGSWVKDLSLSRTSGLEDPIQDAMASDSRHPPSAQAAMRVDAPQSIAQEEGYEGMAVEDVKNNAIQMADGETIEIPQADGDERLQRDLKQAMQEGIQVDYKMSPGIGPNGAEKKWSLKTSDSHPINVSLLIPPHCMPIFVRHVLTCLNPSHPNSAALQHPLLFPPAHNLLDEALRESNVGGNAPIPIGSIPHQPAPSVMSIGGMFLSSCPGKKVRLDGPVKGRAAICRDLAVDLARIKEMGVGCIVCCLDDLELRFLGAPWEEYKAKAAQIGVDVIRIPMPEGLTPASLVTFDEHVERVIRDYTLRGVHVLAHCRAGVGRAGLTACAWAFKMGLIGPSPELEQHFVNMHQGNSLNQACDLSPQECENARVMSTVERAILLIRRRRSIKAIETFEQVNFLASYIAWLRERTAIKQSRG